MGWGGGGGHHGSQRAHVPYTGGVEVGTVPGVHHRKSGVVWVQYRNNTTLYKVELHIFFGFAEEANEHLLEVRKNKPLPNKAPADPEPKAHPPTNPEENKKTGPKENNKTVPEAYDPTNPKPALWDPKDGSQEVKRDTTPSVFTKRYESTHEYMCCVFVHVGRTNFWRKPFNMCSFNINVGDPLIFNI